MYTYNQFRLEWEKQSRNRLCFSVSFLYYCYGWIRTINCEFKSSSCPHDCLISYQILLRYRAMNLAFVFRIKWYTFLLLDHASRIPTKMSSKYFRTIPITDRILLGLHTMNKMCVKWGMGRATWTFTDKRTTVRGHDNDDMMKCWIWMDEKCVDVKKSKAWRLRYRTWYP